MRVRPYLSADFEETFALWRAVSLATYDFLPPQTEDEDRGYFRRVIAVENELVVAEDDRVIVGYLAQCGDLVDRLYVAVERHGEGVGSALLDEARRRSPERVRLFTHQKNVGACRFYERRGFVAVKYGVSPPPESEPDVEYWWQPDGVTPAS